MEGCMMKDVRATRYLLPVALILFTLLLSPNALAKVGQITQYQVANSPNYITAGPDGNLWFTAQLPQNFKVAQIRTTTPGGQTTPIRSIIPTPSSIPRGLTARPPSKVWFSD